MWKKEDSRPQGVPEISTGGGGSLSTPAPSRDASAPLAPSGRAVACISQGIRIKGEITGSEDLFVDGPVEGKLQLTNGSLTVGPNGTVKADVTAREVIVRGRIEGKISGRDRVQLWSTGHVTGEVQTQRLAIEDGAVLRGKVETGKPIDKTDDRGSVAASGKSASTVAVGSGTAVI
jgi:cytoskeletal protein CcmA (bactofilin family)